MAHEEDNERHWGDRRSLTEEEVRQLGIRDPDPETTRQVRDRMVRINGRPGPSAGRRTSRTGTRRTP